MKIDKPFDIIKFIEVECNCCESHRIAEGITFPQNKIDTVKLRYLCTECDLRYFTLLHNRTYEPVNNKKYLWENQLKE